MQHEGFLLPKYGCCGCWKSLLWWSRPHPWTTPLLESRASVYSGAQTTEQIGLNDGNCWGLVEPGHSADAAHVQHSTQDNPRQLRDQPRGCLWRDSSQNALKYPCKIAACELIVLGLCCACSMQMYQFPKGDRWQKHTYNNLDTLCSENTQDKSSVLSCHCHTLQHTPNDIGKFGPGEALHVDVNLTTVYTFVRFWIGPSQQMTLQACHNKYKKELTCTHASLSCVVGRAVLRSVVNTYEHLL